MNAFERGQLILRFSENSRVNQMHLNAGSSALDGKSLEQKGLVGRHLPQAYLTDSVYKVVLQKSTPPQIRQLIRYISNDTG